MANNLILAAVNSGAVATGLGSLLGGNVVRTGRLSARFINTNAASQTFVLKVLRAGGALRHIIRTTLAQWESVEVANLPFDQSDDLQASTTTGSAVDYDITQGDQGPYSVACYDANMAMKQVNSGVSGNQTISGALICSRLNLGTPPTDTFAATMSIDVTKSFHVVAAANGTSATVTYNASGAGNAGDVLVIETAADSSGTVTATFGTNFKKTGTQATTLSHWSAIAFISDGTQWVELARATASS